MFLKKKDTVQKQLSDAETSMSVLDGQRASAAQRVTAGAELSRRVAVLNSAVSSCKAVAIEIEAKCKAYRLELDGEMPELSDQELAQKLKGFESQQESLRKQQAGLERTLLSAEADASKTESELQKLRSETANLNGKLSALQEASDKREAARKQMAKKWNFDANNAEAAGRVLKKMESLLAKTKEELATGRKPYDTAVADAASEVSVIQSERSGLSRTEAQTKQDIKSVEREIEAKRALGGSKASLEQQLEKARKELAAAQETIGDVKAFEGNVDELQKSKNSTEKLLSSLSEQLLVASQSEAALDRVKLARQQVAAKEEEIENLGQRIRPILIRLLSSEELPPSDRLVQAVSAALVQKRKELAASQKKLEELRAARMTTNSRAETLRHEQAGLEKSARAARAQLSLVPGLGEGTSVAEKLALVEATLEEDNIRVAELAAEQALYSKFLQHATSSAEAECLVCERGFDDAEQGAHFGEKLRKKLKVADESLGPAKKERDESEQVVSVLRPAVPIQMELNRVLARCAAIEKELSDVLAGRLKEQSEACDAAAAALTRLQQQLAEYEPLASRAEQLASMTQQLTHLRSDEAKKEADLKKLGAAANKSLAEIKTELAAAQTENAAITKSLAEKRKVLELGRKNIALKEQTIASLMEKLVACDSSAESTAVLQERLAQVRKKNNYC